MDVDALIKGVGFFNSALTALKQAINLLPDNPTKADATTALERAEQEFELAQAEAAKRLGYHLCRCTFPPQIMLFTGEEGCYKCPKCGYEKKPPPPAIPGAGPSRWRL